MNIKALNFLARHPRMTSFILGLTLVFSYAPFSLWFLPLLVLPFWLALLNSTTVKQSFQLGFSFGLGWFISGIGWVHVSIDQFGGLPMGVSYIVMLILTAYLALYPALACCLASRFSATKQFNYALFPIFWMICEYLRSVVLTGFPWLSLGYSQTSGPLISLAPLIGEFGISFVIMIYSVAILQLYRRQHQLISGVVIILCGLLIVISPWLNPIDKTNKTLEVALIQGNIKQELRWAPEQNWATMFKYLDLARLNYDADLIIWPEAAIPSLEPVAQEYLQQVNQAALLNNTSIVTGIIDYNFQAKKYFNSLVVLGKTDNSPQDKGYYYHNNNQFYKHHLLPIGEFVPFEDWLRPLAPLFNLPMSSFSRGDFVQKNLQANGLHIAPLICFEIAFADQLAANLTQQTNLILTVSNDAWFGDSHGPHQHLEIAQMRAAEFGRPVLRATNNGITAVINEYGIINARIPQFEEQVLRTTVSLVQGTTWYAKWQNTPLWIVLGLLFVMVLINQRRNQLLSKPA